MDSPQQESLDERLTKKTNIWNLIIPGFVLIFFPALGLFLDGQYSFLIFMSLLAFPLAFIMRSVTNLKSQRVNRTVTYIIIIFLILVILFFTAAVFTQLDKPEVQNLYP